jgi:hypothetical protein
LRHERTALGRVACPRLLIVWYALHGHHTADTIDQRAQGTVVPLEDRTVHPGHAHQTAPPVFCPHCLAWSRPKESWRSSKFGCWLWRNREISGLVIARFLPTSPRSSQESRLCRSLKFSLKGIE